jgi:DNA-directed RNA polymerase subunit RPC12/RpoP
METSQRFMNRAAAGLITGRPEKLIVGCALCGAPLPHPEYARRYPNLVCRRCDGRALNRDGEHPKGDNPVFIDGRQCWRRYRFGSHLTMLDEYNCRTIVEFFERNE